MRMPEAPSSGPTILIAEAHPSLRHWLGVLLREAGYEVLVARSGPEVLRHLRSSAAIHVVITEPRIGRMPGWEIARETSTLRPGVPVVRLVDSAAEGLPVCRPELDPSVILWKPFTVPQLVGVIRTQLGQGSEPAIAVRRPAQAPRLPREYTFLRWELA